MRILGEIRRNARRRDLVLIAIAVGLIAVALIGILGARRRAEVWIVSGLDVPVDVAIDGTKIPVVDQQPLARPIGIGPHQIRITTAGGEVLEEYTLEVPPFTDAIVINVIGSAPVYLAKIVYARTPTGIDDSMPEFFGGRSVVIRDDVRHVFKTPPRTISTKSGGTITQKHLDVAKGGWRATLGHLESSGRHAEAARLARAIVRARPERRLLGQAIEDAQIAWGTGASIQFLGELAARTSFRDVEEAYQDELARAGRLEDARRIYRLRRAAAPTAIEAALLLARIGTRDEAREILDDLLARSPRPTGAVIEAARRAMAAGEWARCADLYAMATRDPGYPREADRHARCIVGRGDPEGALAMIERLAEADSPFAWEHAITWAGLANLPTLGPRDPSKYALRAARKVGSDEKFVKVVVDARLGRPVTGVALSAVNDPTMRAALEIEGAATDLRTVWSHCLSAPAGAFQHLPLDLALLLAAEFARAGRPTVAHEIFVASNALPMTEDEILAYVRDGKEPEAFGRIDPVHRSALDLVRARRLDELGERQAAEALALAAVGRDLLGSWVTRAARTWPRALGAGAAEPLLAARPERPVAEPPAVPFLVIEEAFGGLGTRAAPKR
jgi:hypothetical protein